VDAEAAIQARTDAAWEGRRPEARTRPGDERRQGAHVERERREPRRAAIESVRDQARAVVAVGDAPLIAATHAGHLDVAAEAVTRAAAMGRVSEAAQAIPDEHPVNRPEGIDGKG